MLLRISRLGRDDLREPMHMVDELRSRHTEAESRRGVDELQRRANEGQISPLLADVVMLGAGGANSARRSAARTLARERPVVFFDKFAVPVGHLIGAGERRALLGLSLHLTA